MKIMKGKTKTTTKIPCKNTHTWRLNNMLINFEWVIEEIKEEIKKYLETNENGDKMIQNLWNTAKAVLRGKFVVIQV